MATAYKIQLSPDQTGVVSFKPQDQATADKVSALLQENHEKHHIYFNEAGFHNHIVHQLLSLYGLGCPADLLERQYKLNAEYQLPPKSTEKAVVENLDDFEVWKKQRGHNDSYANFLAYFQREIEAKGWEQVVNEQLFARTEKADDMLVRVFSGFLHPIIHLGFGIEFVQPAIIAEALAETATHDAWIADFLLPAEHAAKNGQGRISASLPELLDAIRADDKLRTAATWEDANKIRDGILSRAPQEMITYAATWVASPDMLREKTAEMVNAALWFTAGAQKPPKKVKFDFYYMHSANASIFWKTFNNQPWLSTDNKVRLLEWKARMDLALYASRAAPELLINEINQYEPQKPQQSQWSDLYDRAFHIDEDGHTVKLVRATANAQQQTQGYEDRKWAKLNSDEQFLKIANMVVDSIEIKAPDEANWARSVGFPEAWEPFEDRPRASL